MARPEILAVAFDMDGLMFNSEDVYFETGSRLMRLFGCEYTQELCAQVMGLPPKAAFEKMIEWNALDVSWRELQKKSNEIFLSIMPEYLQPMRGLTVLLDFLDEIQIPRAVCTSSCRELVSRMLPLHGLDTRFDFIITSEDVIHGKPAPDIYLLAAERFGISAECMMILEDSHNGCVSGAAAGGFVAAVPGEHSWRQDFSMANIRLESLDDPRIFTILKSDGTD